MKNLLPLLFLFLVANSSCGDSGITENVYKSRVKQLELVDQNGKTVVNISAYKNEQNEAVILVRNPDKGTQKEILVDELP